MKGHFKKRLEEIHNRWGKPGLAVTVVRKPKLPDGAVEGSWEQEFCTLGTANARGDPIREDTILPIASVSKMFVPIALGLLIKDGVKLPNGEVLSWRTKLKSIYPKWKLVDPVATEQANLIDLAAMRTGLPGHDNAIGDIPAAEIIDKLAHLPPSTGFRESYQYMNAMYAILANIVPTLTGQSFQDLLFERIFTPLGMADTSHDHAAARASGRLADGWKQGIDLRSALSSWKGYKKSCDNFAKGDGEPAALPKDLFGKKKPFDYMEKRTGVYTVGPGGILSTPKDMARWMQELMDPQIIPKEVLEKTTTAVAVCAGKPGRPEEGILNYGLGIIVHSYRGRTAWCHSGGVPGVFSYLVVLPDEKIGVMITSNDDIYGGALIKEMAYVVLNSELEVEPQPPSREVKAVDEWLSFVEFKNPDIELKSAYREPPPREKVLGAYCNHGYGEFDIQPISDFPQVEAVLSDLKLASPWAINDSQPMYIARWKRFFTDYILFHHLDGPRYAYMIFRLMDNLDNLDEESTSREKVTFAWGSGLAVFDDKGVGMYGGFGQRGENEIGKKGIDEDDIKGTAEVWFENDEGDITDGCVLRSE